jgi:hypothetical protein
MIISESKKFIFIHIYKTGGSTITDILSPYVDEKFRSKAVKKEGMGWQPTWHINKGQHDKFSQCLSSLDSLNLNLDEYFIFTFVRNPYTWILSVWNNFYRYPTGNSPQDIVTTIKNKFKKLKNILKGRPNPKSHSEQFHSLFPDGSFKSFLLFLDKISKEETKQEKKYWGTYDQYSFIENDRNIVFDFIGKFENLETDLKKLSEKLDLDFPLNLPHRTVSSAQEERKNYLNYYDDESLEIVNRLFKRDFQAFDYPELETRN